MKKISIVIALGSAMMACACASQAEIDAPEAGAQEEEAKAPDERLWLETGDTLRILAIGNSFARDAFEQSLHPLLAADGIASELCVCHIASCSLQMHLDNLSAAEPAYLCVEIDANGKGHRIEGAIANEVLASRPWTYVSLQQVSSGAGSYNTYQEVLPELLPLVRELSGGEPRLVLHQPWAYDDGQGSEFFGLQYQSQSALMYAAIAEATSVAFKSHEFDNIVPSGTAVQNARLSSLGPVMTMDGMHMSRPLGRYIVSCAWYEAITGRDCRLNPYDHPDIDAATEAIAREAAHAAVAEPFQTTAIGM